MKKLIATFLISILTLSASSALAASSTPKPKPTTKTSAKPSAESSTKATKKPVAEKKPVKKKPVKKKVVKKKKKKKLPPLQPVQCFEDSWPQDFKKEGEVYAMIPRPNQLQCESSDNYAPSKVILRADIKQCDDFACGAVAVASETGCTWWEVNSTFEQIDLKSGKILATLGTLRTLSQRTKPNAIQIIMLVSEIKHRDANGKILNNIKASGLEVSCHHDAAPDLSKRNIFKSN